MAFRIPLVSWKTPLSFYFFHREECRDVLEGLCVCYHWRGKQLNLHIPDEQRWERAAGVSALLLGLGLWLARGELRAPCLPSPACAGLSLGQSRRHIPGCVPTLWPRPRRGWQQLQATLSGDSHCVLGNVLCNPHRNMCRCSCFCSTDREACLRSQRSDGASQCLFRPTPDS